jgi:hypothetical protein
MGVSINGGTPKWMVHSGKSQQKIDDLGVPYFRKPLYWTKHNHPTYRTHLKQHLPHLVVLGVWLQRRFFIGVILIGVN